MNKCESQRRFDWAWLKMQTDPHQWSIDGAAKRHYYGLRNRLWIDGKTTCDEDLISKAVLAAVEEKSDE